MDPEPNQGRKAQSSAASAAAIEPGSHAPTATPDGSAVDGSGPTNGSGGSSSPASDESWQPTTGLARKKKSAGTGPQAGAHPNNVRKLRQGAMMSKAELARRAGVSPLTIDRVESGCPCRMDTKRKILEALGLQPSAAKEVFPDVDLG